MKDFTLNAQSHIIADILEHLQNGMIGMAVARAYNYEVKGDTIYFTHKGEIELSPADFFWFGYLTKD